MMFSRFLGAAFVAALCATSMASAQQATPVPNLKPDFSSMQFLLGTWNCKTVKNTMGRGSGRTETDVNTMTLDGHYMLTNSTSKPFDKARTTTLVSQGWLGYDTVKKQWYTFGISNFGGFGMSTSPGWKGNKIVWTDTYSSDGQPLGLTTITKVSDTKTTSANVTKGQASSDQCTKS
jgi:hypothetical protein